MLTMLHLTTTYPNNISAYTSQAASFAIQILQVVACLCLKLTSLRQLSLNPQNKHFSHWINLFALANIGSRW